MFHFEIGQKVKIKGLQKNLTLNGCYGRIIRGLDEDRYGVQIEKTDMVKAQQINVKPVNLVYIEPEKPNDMELINNKLQEDIEKQKQFVDSCNNDLNQTNDKIDEIKKQTEEVEKQMKYYEELMKFKQQQLQELE